MADEKTNAKTDVSPKKLNIQVSPFRRVLAYDEQDFSKLLQDIDAGIEADNTEEVFQKNQQKKKLLRQLESSIQNNQLRECREYYYRCISEDLLQEGQSLLEKAVASDADSIISFLLIEVNANQAPKKILSIDINAYDSENKTVLHNASIAGNVKSAEVILKMNHLNPNISARDDDGWTPLHFSAFYGHLDLVKLLVRYGADCSLKNTDDETALDLIKNKSDEKYVKIREYLQKKMRVVIPQATSDVLFSQDQNFWSQQNNQANAKNTDNQVTSSAIYEHKY